MLPAGDHNSRSLLIRRVSSWSQVTLEDSSSTDLNQPLLPELEYEEASVASTHHRKRNWKLWIIFAVLVISGVGNVILAKLQAVPMYNYPTFLTVYTNMMYLPINFLYILPTAYFGWFNHSIPRSHLISLSKKPFLVMGALDALSAAMQVLASVYLPGTLLVLLPQAAIPLSMLASRIVLREKFTQWQYMGAGVVFLGICVVLFPVMTHRHAPYYSCQAVNNEEDCSMCQIETTEEECLSHEQDFFTLDGLPVLNCQWISRDESLRQDDVLVFVWSLVMVASCLPMVLSSVYKQVALESHLDPLLVNGWVAVFQFLCSLPLAIPAGLVSSPRVSPLQLPQNWLRAMECLFRHLNSIDSGCHPDTCVQAAMWVHLGLLCSVVYTISIIFVLKYGSSSMLYLGLTVMVPLGHLVFAMHSPAYIRVEDIIGLCVLLAGLLLYRFGHEEEPNPNETNYNTEGDKDGYWEFLREPFMLSGDV